jgi:hypothetical protein
MDSHYGNVIWTYHALSRMQKRGIKQSEAFATWKNPDKSRYAKAKATWIYNRNINGKKTEVVAKKNEKGEWVILSVWSKQGFVKTDKKKGLLGCIYDFFRYNK